jgi:tetratricopeptide (TPR) repeat protein
MLARRTTAAALTVSAVAVAGLFGGLLRHTPAPPALLAPNPGQAEEVSSAGFSAGDTQALVAKLQGQLQTDPGNVQGLDQLGLAYQQRARETGDPTYYKKSGGVLDRALSLKPRDLLATSGLGSLALSQHRFQLALDLGQKAHAISPTTARNYAVIGDAQIELGRYRPAFHTFDELAAMKPGLTAYSRIAHAQLLLGQIRASQKSFALALDSAAQQPEPEAWTRVQIAKLLFSIGKIDAADSQDRAALRAFPGYPAALDALALAEWARGNTANALRLERRAVHAIPLPQYVAQLGDLEAASGHPYPARREYELIGAIQRLLVANGVKTDLETALFNADHAITPKQTLALARLAHRERPSIDGDDVLAWALARSGRCQQALAPSAHSLRLGTKDALKFFHRAYIERCAGNAGAARAWAQRALALNPHFSILWSGEARKIAAASR